MNSDSPMMHRVKRSRTFLRLPTLPRKGRIRIILVILFATFFVRFSPAIVQKIQLPVSAAVQDTTLQPTTAANKAHQEARQETHNKARNKARKNMILTNDVTRLLSEYSTTCFSQNSATVVDEKDSLTVFTSIDTGLQAYIGKLMDRYHPLYGALVALDPFTGRILALASYTNDSSPQFGGNLCLRSLFPAASIYKTITSAAAIEYAGFEAGCMVEHRGRNHTLYHSQLKPELDWANDLTFSQAYSRSINAVFGRIGMYELGREVLLDYSNRFGFNTPLPGELSCEISRVMVPDSLFDLAELASGFNQKTTLSPLHGALIAACIAGNGAMPVPTIVDSIVRQRDNATRYAAERSIWRYPVDQATAREMQSMMYAVAATGTASKHFRDIRNSRRFDDFIYGGKTGSVDKDSTGRVDWFIGFAVHPEKIDERIAIGAVTVHGAYWTVHSSYLAAETIDRYLRKIQERKKLLLNDSPLVQADSSAP